MEYKATVTPAILAFGASEGVFVTVFRIEKHRKIGAHRFITLGEHLFSRRANDDAVYIGDLDAQKAITHGAADFVDFHEKASISGTG